MQTVSARSPTDARVGPKQPVTGRQAVCASQHPIATETMLQVMKDGGNVVDAAIAACLVQAVVQQEMTNHAGTVSFLYWEKKTGKSYYLNSMGTLVPDLAPFRRVPKQQSTYASLADGPIAVIPGFMPGMKAMYERFASKPWDYLCQPAIHWAEEGHVVNSFEHEVLVQHVGLFLYTESGREHFMPNGFLPQVGDRWPKPALAHTLKKLAGEGPDYFITGEWAQHFVERANAVGWKIEMKHMQAVPPRWSEPSRFTHRGYEILQPAPPEQLGVFCSLVLGMLRELDITSLGHYTESAEAFYYFAHALRRAAFETGYLNDPEIFGDPTGVLMSLDYQAQLAETLRRSKPKIDLTRHVELVSPPAALAAAGANRDLASQPTAGSCELSIVDPQGNWVQMMNTLQTGGIAGEVVDGVCMVGSHNMTSMASAFSGWYTGGGRMRSMIGNTIVLKDGAPRLSLGTPGTPNCTVPQVLSNILDYGMDPYAAEDAPRMLPLEDSYRVGVESRIAASVVSGLAKLGILVNPLPRYQYGMGSFQMSWRTDDGLLHGTAGPRRAGTAAAL